MMRALIAAGVALSLSAGAGLSQDRIIDIGRQEFMIACAGCHGETAMGTGPLAELLSIETPNLTTITQRAGGGEFPYRNTTLVIDGRNGIRAHGGAMPVWGDRYVAAVRSSDDAWVSPEAADLVATGRVLALVRYLESIQK